MCTAVTAPKGAGALLTWDIAKLPAQEKAVDGVCGEDGENDSGNEEHYKGDTGWRDHDDLDDLEGTRGVMPHGQHMLARPNISGLDLNRTCMLSDFVEGGGRTLVVTYEGYGADILVAYDVETQKVKQQVREHLLANTNGTTLLQARQSRLTSHQLLRFWRRAIVSHR